MPAPENAFPSLVWKQVYMPNTWLFITKEPTNIALTCNGIREDIVLKNTGIIQIEQNCILKTKQNTLTAKIGFQ